MARPIVTPVRSVDDGERRARLGRRHGLAPGARFADAAACAAAMVALHATEPATVHLGLRARVEGLTVDDVERALYGERSIVKQMAMRRTLFAFERRLVPAVWGSAGARVAKAYGARLAKDLEESGVAEDGSRWIDAATEAVVDALDGGEAVTSSELRRLVPMIDVSVERGAGTKWGGAFPVAPQLLTVLAAQGRVARAHNAGHWRLSKPTWTTSDAWFGERWEPTSEADGYRELVRGWLRAFGPGTETDLQWWLGGTLRVVRAALASLEAVAARLESGEIGWLLPDDLDVVEPADDWVALLPTLDSTVMGWKERAFHVGEHGPALFDSAGNAGTTAWWNGRVVGCWLQDDDGSVRVHPLEELPARVERAFDDEAERLTGWLDGVRVVTIYVSPAMRSAR